jgi:hypothetical protein
MTSKAGLFKRVAVCVLLMVGVARAQSDDALARARSHFEAGRALYNLKQYTDAIREFSAGYQLVAKPQFLVNLGQCYDRLAEGTSDPGQKREALEHSREMYKKFLADAPRDPLRDQVTQIVNDLDQRIAGLPPAPPKKETPPPEQPKKEPTVTNPPPNPQPLVVTNQDQPKKKSGIAKYWWIIPVAAVVVVGVSLGAYFGTRSTGPDCGSATFGCVYADGKSGLIQY